MMRAAETMRRAAADLRQATNEIQKLKADVALLARVLAECDMGTNPAGGFWVDGFLELNDDDKDRLYAILTPLWEAMEETR